MSDERLADTWTLEDNGEAIMQLRAALLRACSTTGTITGAAHGVPAAAGRAASLDLRAHSGREPVRAPGGRGRDGGRWDLASPLSAGAEWRRRPRQRRIRP
jgi:hypothetical protein